MPRKHRSQEPGGIFHIATRSVFETFAFRTPDDRLDFLWIFSTVVETFSWLCKSYCLMGSHYHLIVQTPEPNLSDGMQTLNGKYAQRFNRRHGRRGHLFGERFYSVQLETDSHLLTALRYVARNPVEAGMCAAPLDWRWSSSRATAGLESAPGFLDLDGVLGLFGVRRQAARAGFVRLVEDSARWGAADEAVLVELDGV
jgi:putative transposase